MQRLITPTLPTSTLTMEIGILLSAVLACVLLVVVHGLEKPRNSPRSDDFESYKRHHSKRYKNKRHEAESLTHFLRNRDKIYKHNRLAAEGAVRYKMELNELMDLSEETLKGMNGLVVPKTWLNEQRRINRRKWHFHGLKTVQGSPVVLDFRNLNNRNYVTPAKHQGQCGNCFVFAAVGAMESQILINGLAQKSLSEEQVTDCIHEADPSKLKVNYTGNGCEGGFPLDVFQYVKDIGGITTEDVYPYGLLSATVSAPCMFNPRTAVQKVSIFGGASAPTNEELKFLLYNKGPLSVAINTEDLTAYKEGVYENENVDVDHAVLLVGYGNSEKDGEYWIMKNSWGTNFGEDQGFFRVTTDRSKNAGLTGNQSAIAWVELL